MPDDVKPHLTIRPGSGWAALNLAEVWQFRDLLFTLAGRDIKVRYKQTFLGVLWVILQPVIGAGVFTVIFGKVLDVKTGNTPYFLVAYSSLLGWNLFSGVLGKASGCLVGNAGLISKVYFPRFILPLNAIPSTIFDFGIALVIMIPLLIRYHIFPGPALLLLPLWIAMLIAAALGVGLVTAALMVSYRDVGYIMPLITQMLF